jgi:hypothetical protein
MTGKELHKVVRNSGKMVKEISEISSIPEQTIYSLYKKNEVPLHYIDSMSKAIPQLQETIDAEEEITKEDLFRIIETLTKAHETLGRATDTLADAFDLIKEDHKNYQTLVNQGLKDGTLKFIHKKSTA